MKIDKALIESYSFTIRPLSEADGGGFAIEYPDLPVGDRQLYAEYGHDYGTRNGLEPGNQPLGAAGWPRDGVQRHGPRPLSRATGRRLWLVGELTVVGEGAFEKPVREGKLGGRVGEEFGAEAASLRGHAGDVEADAGFYESVIMFAEIAGAEVVEGVANFGFNRVTASPARKRETG